MPSVKPTAPPALLESRALSPAKASKPSPLGPETGDTELDTGTLTDSASMWSGKVIGQSVVLKREENYKIFPIP